MWTFAASVGLHAAVLVQFGPGDLGTPWLWTAMGRIAHLGSDVPGADDPDAHATAQFRSEADDSTFETLIPIEVSEQGDDSPRPSTKPSPSDERISADESSAVAAESAEVGPATRAHASGPPSVSSRPARPKGVTPRVVSAGASSGGREGPAGGGAAAAGDPSGRQTETEEASGAGAMGVRGMTLPLLRVLPLALSADPSWSTLPLGRVGSFELTFALGTGGRVHLESPMPGGSVAAPQLRALVDQMLRLLTWPRFAVRSSEMVDGIDKVRLTISIAQDLASAHLVTASGGAYGLGADPPEGRRPGKAHCTWANGRRVNVTLERLDY